MSEGMGRNVLLNTLQVTFDSLLIIAATRRRIAPERVR